MPDANRDYYPIVLFVYKRLDHLTAVIDALKSNPEAAGSELFVYSDAPAVPSDDEGVQAVRNYLKDLNGFKRVVITERETNFGIEKSEIDGVTRTVNEYGAVIVLEDDIVVGNQFLKYMNYCLREYENDRSIYTVTGYSFLKTKPGKDNLFGRTGSFCAWGWGTWKDRWQNFKRTVTKKDLTLAIRNKRKIDNGQDYTYLLMHQYKNGRITWDVAWYLTCFEKGGMTLFPHNSLINNIGMDGSGVHYNDSTKKNRTEPVNARNDIVFPMTFMDDEAVVKETEAESARKNNRSIFRKCKMLLRLWVNYIEILFWGPSQLKG